MQNGYLPAPAPLTWSDDESNVMASMAHEGCEWHCTECGHCETDVPRLALISHLDGEPYCEDCIEVANCHDAPTTTHSLYWFGRD